MWVPRWLGEVYCELYAEFGTKEFEFGQALERLGRNERELRVFLSGLRRCGFVDVLGRKGRKRVYRVADPAEVAMLLGKKIDLRGLPEVIRPVLRSYLRGLFERYGERVVSVVLYGSFGRGEYARESDIDLLLVIEGYHWRESLSFDTADELALKQWRLSGHYHKVVPYPLTPEQARYHRPIYLDMTVDGRVLYDRGGFITNILDGVRRRLAELGAKRCRLPSGARYWVLKPDLRPGEVVEI
jgi:hypothetical protein